MADVTVTQADLDKALVAAIMGRKDWGDATDYRNTGAEDREVERLLKLVRDYRHRIAALSQPAVDREALVEEMTKIIDPDAWHESLPTDGCGQHWHGRRNKARRKARAAIVRRLRTRGNCGHPRCPPCAARTLLADAIERGAHLEEHDVTVTQKALAEQLQRLGTDLRYSDEWFGNFVRSRLSAILTALEQHLKPQAAAEPVAWMYTSRVVPSVEVSRVRWSADWLEQEGGYSETPLYAHPPADLTAKADAMAEALEKIISFHDGPVEAKRPDVFELRINRARAALDRYRSET